MSVTFTRATKTEVRGTGVITVSTTTVVGVAIQTRGNPIRYRELGLVEAEAPTLLWVPDTYGETPQPGDTVTWNSLSYTVADVNRLAPDGVTITAKVIIKR